MEIMTIDFRASLRRQNNSSFTLKRTENSFFTWKACTQQDISKYNRGIFRLLNDVALKNEFISPFLLLVK